MTGFHQKQRVSAIIIFRSYSYKHSANLSLTLPFIQLQPLLDLISVFLSKHWPFREYLSVDYIRAA
jgi:hypothetical protein